MVGCVYPRGAVGSRLKPWTRLRGSESHWLSSGAPCRTAWSAGEQHKSAHIVRQFVDGILQPAYSVGESVTFNVRISQVGNSTLRP